MGVGALTFSRLCLKNWDSAGNVSRVATTQQLSHMTLDKTY